MRKLIIGFVAVLLLAGCSYSSEEEMDGPIKIGAIAPLSGETANFGTQAQKTANLRIKQLNASGGVNGRDIELIWEDGKCNPGDASEAIQKLIRMDKVHIVFGGACSGETLGAAPIAEKNKVVMLSSISTNPTITDAGDFIFRVAPSDFTQGKILAEHAESMGFEKVGILTEQTDGAMGISDAFKQYYSGEVIEEKFISSESDFKTRLVKIKAENPDAILLSPQSEAKTNIIVKQLMELQWDKPIMGHELFVGELAIYEDYKDFLVENTVVASTFAAPESEALSTFMEEYKAVHGDVPTYSNYTATTLDAMDILVKVLSSVEDVTDTESIRDALYATQDYEGVFGNISFDENGDVNIYHSLFEFDGEKLVPLASNN
jgi:branched-chain amino acid transport system substrate-binding protein